MFQPCRYRDRVPDHDRDHDSLPICDHYSVPIRERVLFIDRFRDYFPLSCRDFYENERINLFNIFIFYFGRKKLKFYSIFLFNKIKFPIIENFQNVLIIL